MTVEEAWPSGWMLGYDELAVLLGRPRAAVRQMRLRGELPRPDGVGPAWGRGTVEAWLEGRLTPDGVTALGGGRLPEVVGPQCWYCGTDEAPRWHREHQTPRSRGGSEPTNVVVSCEPCNLSKGTLTVEEFRLKRQREQGGGAVVFFGETLPEGRIPEQPWSWYRVLLPDELVREVEVAAAAAGLTPSGFITAAVSDRLTGLRGKVGRLHRAKMAAPPLGPLL